MDGKENTSNKIESIIGNHTSKDLVIDFKFKAKIGSDHVESIPQK